MIKKQVTCEWEYDPDNNVAYLRFPSDGSHVRTTSRRWSVILDYQVDNNRIVGLEFLDPAADAPEQWLQEDAQE